MNNAGRYFLVGMALLALSYPTALADTLELKDGRLLEGTYVGGTRTTLRFQIEDRVEVIPIQDALAVTFSGSGPLASGPASTPPSETASTQPSTAGPIVVPAGTRVLVRVVEGINSKKDAAGSRFTAMLEANLEVNGRVVAPKGSEVYGRLTSAKRGGRAFGKAKLQLELTDIMIDDQLQPIITSEYKLTGRSQGTLRNTAIGGGLGALIDGGDGAKKGAAAGLGYSLLTKGKQVSVPSGTLIEFRLEQSLTVRGSILVGRAPSGLRVTEPVALVGPPGPVRPPQTFEQLWVFGTSSTGFPHSMFDPRWRPGSDWDDSTDLNNFNPSRWYQAPIDPSWKPQPAFTEDDDVTNFNPSRWQMGILDPNWYPEDGFKRRDVSSPSE